MRPDLVKQIIDLIGHLTLEEQFTVFEQLARQLRRDLGDKKQTSDLYGLWQDRFPTDFDLDSVLDEMRHDWQKEWAELTT
ncbi:MAG: hypothetical protein KA314_26005 [Chloroflexi bacterium]|nr:hypothetical protein [Chloroflexota bacterium]MBP8059304.1 hypothetical protein [Chloroflexota bacterium]